MNTTKTEMPAPPKSKPKKAYASPRLITYGHVRSLTLTGANMSGEAAGSSGPTFMSSDRVTKENIVRVGVHPLGIGLYLFDYRPEYREECGRGRQFGVMADEVEDVMPGAVSVHPGGHKIVNYRMLGISRPLQ